MEIFVSHLAYASCVRESLDLVDVERSVVVAECVFESSLSLS